MPTIKIKQWGDWWDGMRSKMMKAGAESLVSNLGALLATNGIANMEIPGLSNIGMGWKTAILTTCAQFIIRVLFAGASYVASKPDPDVITETIETQHVKRDAETGNITEVGKSVTTTETPVTKV